MSNAINIWPSKLLGINLTNPITMFADKKGSAQQKMKKSSPWFGWKVFDVEIVEVGDTMVRLTVYAEPASPALRSGGASSRSFHFYIRKDGEHSDRFAAFVSSTGLVGQIEDTRELEGRYFATRNNGGMASDFDLFVKALV